MKALVGRAWIPLVLVVVLAVSGLMVMLGSNLRVIGQFGSTVAIGLLSDTLIVRSLLMPSIATLLGRWFWWPQVVYPRGDYTIPQTQRPTEDTDTAPVPTQR